MDSDTRQEMDEIKAAQLRTNQSLEKLTEITANLATTVSTFVEEQQEINKSLKAGQDQLAAIANKLLDDKQ